MSGIFGFTYRTADRSELDDALGGLEYWNRVFGGTDHDSKILGTSGIGCHIEHFSDQFPHGGPILHYRGMSAVVDALLYNRDELLPMLSMDPDPAISDEELLLALIDQKGFRVLRQVNGDFAGAIFDEERQQWTLFRDHLGVRPLYYYADDDKVVFSTDLRGVVSVPGVDSAIDSQFLIDSALAINFLSQTKTEFEHIRCVHPGSITTLSLGKVRRKLYWKVRERKIRLGSDGEYIKKMRELVTDAVHRRCDAIPGLLGAELSGGLDSGAIDIILNRHGREAVYFSWCTSPEIRPLVSGDDERKVILDICEQENITCRFFEPGDNFYFNDELAAHMPPFSNTPNLVAGSKWMRTQGARAVFSGHGGDEGVSHRASPFELLYNWELWSYFRIHWLYLKGHKLRLLRAIWSGILEAAAKFPANFARAGREDVVCEPFTEELVDRLIRGKGVTQTPFRYAPYKYVRQGGSRFRLETSAFMGAYSGVRYLFPYIDYRVMDYAVSIPRRMHVNHEVNRLIFRQAFADILPASLRELTYKDMPSIRNTNRSKLRFPQMRRNIEYLLEHLDEEVWKGILDFDGLRAMRDTDTSDTEDISMKVIVISNLNKCLLIQDTLKNAPRWRDLDAEHI